MVAVRTKLITEIWLIFVWGSELNPFWITIGRASSFGFIHGVNIWFIGTISELPFRTRDAKHNWDCQITCNSQRLALVWGRHRESVSQSYTHEAWKGVCLRFSSVELFAAFRIPQNGGFPIGFPLNPPKKGRPQTRVPPAAHLRSRPTRSMVSGARKFWTSTGPSAAFRPTPLGV